MKGYLLGCRRYAVSTSKDDVCPECGKPLKYRQVFDHRGDSSFPEWYDEKEYYPDQKGCGYRKEL